MASITPAPSACRTSCPAVAAIGLRGGVCVRQAATVSGRAGNEERAAGGNADAWAVRPADRETSRGPGGAGWLRPDPYAHAADGAGGPDRCSPGRCAACVPRSQPGRPRLDASLGQLDQLAGRVGLPARRRSVDHRVAQPATVHDRPRLRGRAHGVRAERRAGGRPRAASPHARRQLDDRHGRAVPAAEGHRSVARNAGRAAVERSERAATGRGRFRNPRLRIGHSRSGGAARPGGSDRLDRLYARA